MHRWDLTLEFTRPLQRAKPAVAGRVQRRVRQRHAIFLHRLKAAMSEGDRLNHSPSPRLSANRLCQ